MASPAASRLYPEVISIVMENVHHTEDIKACSLSCSLWRETGQRILFKNLRFHLSEGPYDIVREEHRHLCKYVKDVQLEGTESESDVFPDDFAKFLDCLSALRCLRLQIPKMDWSRMPPPAVNSIVRLLRSSSLEELHVSKAMKFPLRLPLCCTQLKALSIWETEVTAEGFEDIVIRSTRSPLTVENLRIHFLPSLRVFREFLLRHTDNIMLEAMTVLHVRYAEEEEEELDPRNVGLFLSSFGTSVEKLDFTIQRKGNIEGYQFTKADLSSLNLLRELSVALIVRGNTHPEDSVLQWLRSIVENIPSSAPLRKFEFVCTIFFVGTPTLSDLRGSFSSICNRLDLFLAYWIDTLKDVDVELNFRRRAAPRGAIKLNNLFPLLAQKGAKVAINLSLESFD